jgi:hypothetical protein
MKIVHQEFSAKVPADTDLSGVKFYFDPANDADFLAKASVGDWPADLTKFVKWDGTSERVTLVLKDGDLSDGIYDVAAASTDNKGNQSDAVTSAEYTDLPLDATAPGVPTELATASF